MRRTDSLFQLVKAMSRTDKRNFRLMTQMTSGDKKYLRLFDAIDRQSVYDEDRLVKQFRNDPMVKQFSVSKNYLYNSILRSLVHFYQGKSQDCSPTMLQVAILSDKNLHAQAMKLLRKAKSRAEKVEDFQEWLQLLQAERRLVAAMMDLRNLAQQVEQIGLEEAEVEKRADNLRAYQHLLDQVDLIRVWQRQARDRKERDRVEKLLSCELLQDIGAALSLRARLHFYMIWARSMAFCFDLPGAVRMGAAFLGELGKAKKLGDHLEEEQLQMLRLMGESWATMQNESEFQAVAKAMAGMSPESESARKLKERGQPALRLRFAVESGNLREGIAAAADFESVLEAQGDWAPASERLELAYQAGRLHLMAGKFKEALRWTNFFLDASRSEIWQDWQGYVRIANVIVNYELENVDLLEHCLKSTVRFLFKRSRMYKVERLVLRGIRRLMQAEEYEQRKEIFREMLLEADQLSTDAYALPGMLSLGLRSYLAGKLGVGVGPQGGSIVFPVIAGPGLASVSGEL